LKMSDGIVRFVGKTEEDGDTKVLDMNASLGGMEKEEFEAFHRNNMEEEFDWEILFCWYIDGADTSFEHTPADTLIIPERKYENLKYLDVDDTRKCARCGEVRD